MASATPTTSHTRIRKWVESRGGHPARVKRTGSRKDPGVLRIDFPGFSGEDTLEEIDWDSWFDAFDRNNLAMLIADGPRSRFNKLIERAAGRASKSSRRVVKSTSDKAAKRTTSHATIRKWVESRGGFPATVKGTKKRGEEAGLLRIDYPGYSGKETLERIEWDAWFEKFDKENLAFLYSAGPRSRFSKLVER